MRQLVGEVQLADDLNSFSWRELLLLCDNSKFFSPLLGVVGYDSVRVGPLGEVNENLCTQEDHLSHVTRCLINVAGRSDQ